ncbi:hypothetical protein ACFL96_13045 [Thermoproteota archaeon]
MESSIEMCPGLKDHQKRYSDLIGGILYSYNGDRNAAIGLMNSLYRAVNAEKGEMPRYDIRNMGRGVSVEELRPAAEIGLSLCAQLGYEKGSVAAWMVFRQIIRSGKRITVDDARDTLDRTKTLVELMELQELEPNAKFTRQYPASYDHQIHSGENEL